MPLDFEELGAGIGDATAVLRANAASAGLSAGVPGHRERTIRDLVVSQGVRHRISTAELTGIESSELDDLRAQAEAATDLLEWLDDGMVEVLNALAAAPEDRQAWFFTGTADPARVQVARTLCHRGVRAALEAMAARLGRQPRTDEVWFSPALAADGLDWLTTNEPAAAQEALYRAVAGTAANRKSPHRPRSPRHAPNPEAGLGE